MGYNSTINQFQPHLIWHGLIMRGSCLLQYKYICISSSAMGSLSHVAKRGGLSRADVSFLMNKPFLSKISCPFCDSDASN